jgi:hypothetical protein
MGVYIDDGWHDLRLSLRTTLSLAAAKVRRSLFGEGAATFNVILAGVAGSDQLLAKVAIYGRRHGGKFRNSLLNGSDCQRSILRDGFAISSHKVLKFCHWQDAVNKTHGLRFSGGELAAGKEDFFGVA